MIIFYNDQTTELPKKNMTIEELATWKDVPAQGAAIAVNDKLIKKSMWSVTQLQPMDKVTVITAAFGG